MLPGYSARYAFAKLPLHACYFNPFQGYDAKGPHLHILCGKFGARMRARKGHLPDIQLGHHDHGVQTQEIPLFIDLNAIEIISIWVQPERIT